MEEFGDELAYAFEEFHPESRRIGERDFALLLTWFNSDREVTGGGTPVARYLERPDLGPVEREVAGRIAAARLGLHRVRAVVPGRSLELENVITGAVSSIVSQSVSREVVRWDIVLCRVMAGEPAASLWGPVLVYAPEEEQELVAELERLAVAHGLSRDRAELSEVFQIASRELLRFVPPSRLAEPSYFTAEGDPIVSARAVWRLADPDAAFVALDTPPELLWVGESEERNRRVLPAHRRQEGTPRPTAAAAAERALLRELLRGVPGEDRDRHIRSRRLRASLRRDLRTATGTRSRACLKPPREQCGAPRS